jgi:hypothetical protein
MGCHDLAFSAIQFTHSGAFARVEHSIEDYLDVALTFRTIRSNCLLTYTETSAATERGYVQVSGKFVHIVMPMRQKNTSFHVSSPNCFK